MPSFDVDTEEITAFEISNSYLFEIPESDLEQVRQILDEFFYDLVIEDSWEDYCVATDKEADTSSILRNSVMRKHRGHHEIYLMKDKLSVEQAIEHGATEIEKSGVNTEELEWKTDGS
jgi:hypothetical protein